MKLVDSIYNRVEICTPLIALEITAVISFPFGRIIRELVVVAKPSKLGQRTSVLRSLSTESRARTILRRIDWYRPRQFVYGRRRPKLWGTELVHFGRNPAKNSGLHQRPTSYSNLLVFSVGRRFFVTAYLRLSHSYVRVCPIDRSPQTQGLRPLLFSQALQAQI